MKVNFLRKPHTWENSRSQGLSLKVVDQSDLSVSQFAISFEPFNRFLYIYFFE